MASTHLLYILTKCELARMFLSCSTLLDSRFSINAVSFSPNPLLSDPSFSINVVWKRAMLSVRGVYGVSARNGQYSVNGILPVSCLLLSNGALMRKISTKFDVNAFAGGK